MSDVKDQYKRSDSRLDNQIRPIESEQALLNKADGSAKFTQNKSSVLAAVYGPIDTSNPRKEKLSKALVEVNYTPAIGNVTYLDKEKELLIKNSVETLLDAGIEMTGLIGSITLCFNHDNRILIDPTSKEENESKATAIYAFSNKSTNLVMTKTVGILSEQQYFDGLKIGRDSCDKIIAYIKLASGGHSCCVLSVHDEAVAIDLSELNSIEVCTKSKTTTVGPGVTLKRFYNEITKHNLVSPGGACPSVNLGGLLLGGGSNFLSPKYGYLVDNVLEMKVLLSNGLVVTCSNTLHPELFYGMRGAGHAGFGILVSATIQLHPMEPLYYINFVTIPFESIVDNFEAVMNFTLTMDKWIYVNMEIRKLSKRNSSGNIPKPSAKIYFFYVGDHVVGEARFRELVKILKGDVQVKTYDSRKPFVDIINSGHKEQIRRSFTKARMFPQTVTRKTLQEIKLLFETAPRLDQMTEEDESTQFSINFYYQNGEKTQSKDFNAFHHRDYYWNVVTVCSYQKEANDQLFSHWKDRFGALLDTVSPYIYQNYPDSECESWQNAYYGDNYPRLQLIKKQYDPDNYFNHFQSIEPSLDSKL
eukprot:gene11134-13634_t